MNKYLLEKAGARGCSNSDYNLVITTCCNSYLVEDDELNDIYYDPTDLNKVLDITYQGSCPICNADAWDYIQLDEWPKEKIKWQWAYHPNQELIAKFPSNEKDN